jgi:hypothetical protein
MARLPRDFEHLFDFDRNFGVSRLRFADDRLQTDICQIQNFHGRKGRRKDYPSHTDCLINAHLASESSAAIEVTDTKVVQLKHHGCKCYQHRWVASLATSRRRKRGIAVPIALSEKLFFWVLAYFHGRVLRPNL